MKMIIVMKFPVIHPNSPGFPQVIEFKGQCKVKGLERRNKQWWVESSTTVSIVFYPAKLNGATKDHKPNRYHSSLFMPERGSIISQVKLSLPNPIYGQNKLSGYQILCSLLTTWRRQNWRKWTKGLLVIDCSTLLLSVQAPYLQVLDAQDYIMLAVHT